MLKPHILSTIPSYIARSRIGNTGCWNYIIDDGVMIDDRAIATPISFDYDYNTSHYYNWIEHIIGVRPDSIEELEDRLYPYYQGHKIYLTKSERLLFSRKLKPKKLDRSIISYKTLAPVALREFDGITYDDKGCTRANGIDLTGVYLEDRILDLKNKGCTAFNLKDSRIPLIREIVVYTGLESLEINGVLLIKSNNVLGCELRMWIKSFINQCLTDNILESLLPITKDLTPQAPVKLVEHGIMVGDKLFIRLEQTCDDHDKYLKLQSLFLQAWDRGHFANKWGNFYTALTGKFSVLYLSKNLIFKTIKEAIKHLERL